MYVDIYIYIHDIFIMIANYCFHVFGATIADLDPVSVEDLVEVVVLRKMLIK